jgi:hypothetical protein
VLGVDHGSTTLTQALQTLRAASFDKEASKALLSGTLAGEVEQGGFGPLLSAVPAGNRKEKARTPKPKAKPRPPPKPKPDPNVAKRARVQKQLNRAKERVRELEARLDELRG